MAWPSDLEKTTYGKDRTLEAARVLYTEAELDEFLYQHILEESRHWNKQSSEKFIGVIADLITSEYPSNREKAQQK